jgi:hypothetical protein
VRGRRWATRAVGAALVVVAAAGSLGVGHVDAQAASTFTLQARADAVGLQLIAKDAPAVSIGGGEVAFVTPASAQSVLDSLGGSRAFASSPYPGDLVVSLPATVSGLLGGTSFPVPGYPFYVSSSHPTADDSSEEVGPYSIAAHSSADASDAVAKIGLSTAPPQVASITSRTAVSKDEQTGKAVAEATTEIAPFSVSNLLRLGDIRATARVEYDPARPDQPAVVTTSFSVGTVTIAGIEVGLTDKGLVVGGQTLVPVDLSALTSLLAGAGTSIEYLPAQRSATSVTSAAVRITYQQTFPTLGLTTVRLVLGQVSATADPGAAIGGFSSTPPAVAPVALPAAVGPAPAAPATGGGLSLPETAAPTPVIGPTVGPATPMVARRSPGPDLGIAYGVMALGGAVALLTSQDGAWLALRRRLARSPR